MTISPEPYNLKTWNLYRRTQQGLAFIKDVLKYRDIHIRFGTASPCVGFGTYALIILCDHICQTPQTVDVQLVLLDIARACKRLAINPREVYIMPAS